MNISEALLREIVEKVLAETVSGGPGFEKQVDPSGIIGIKTSTVPLEPFEGRSDVMLKDVTTLEEVQYHSLAYNPAMPIQHSF